MGLVNTKEKDDKFEITFNIIFAKPIGENDIVIRAWDSNKNAFHSRIYDAWNITGNKYVIEDEPLFLFVEPEEIEEFIEDEDKELILEGWAGYYKKQLQQERSAHADEIRRIKKNHRGLHLQPDHPLFVHYLSVI